MAKKKRFERKLARPTLAASLEAVRQGQVALSEPTARRAGGPPIVQQVPAETPSTEPVEETSRPSTAPTGEAQFVKAEVTRIFLLVGALSALLIALTVTESRTGILTQTARRFLAQ